MKMIVERGSFIFLSMLFLSGCMIGPGAGDYSIPLINDYEVVRLSRHNIIIGKLDGIIEGGSWHNVVPPKVLKVGVDEQMIGVLIQPTDDLIDVKEEESLQQYYVIDTLTDEVSGPLSKQEYEHTYQIILKSLDEYEKRY